MSKPLKEFTFDQLVSMQAGQALEDLGQGTRIHTIMHRAMALALQWRQEQEPVVTVKYPDPREDRVLHKVKEIVSEMMAKPLDSLSPDQNFIGDLGADSLDAVEMQMSVEEEFNIEIMESEADKILTIGDAVALVLRKLGKP